MLYDLTGYGLVQVFRSASFALKLQFASEYTDTKGSSASITVVERICTRTWAVRFLHYNGNATSTGKRVAWNVVCLGVGINGGLAIEIAVGNNDGRAMYEDNIDEENDKNGCGEPPIHVDKV